MANVIIPQRFWNRRGTAAALAAANETLYAGEWCLETDTGKAKFGDGVTAWNDLGYSVPGRFNLSGLAGGDTPVWDDVAEEWVPGSPEIDVNNLVGFPGGTSDFLRADGSFAAPPGGGSEGAIGATFDGSGAVLSPGVFADVLVPFGCTIIAATLLADQTGSLVLSVLADPYASFPPTTDIAPTAPPTITASDKSQDSTLSGWTTAIAAGTVVRFGIVSCTSIQRATLTLEVTKT